MDVFVKPVKHIDRNGGTRSFIWTPKTATDELTIVDQLITHILEIIGE
jgi:hypothetical protein